MDGDLRRHQARAVVAGRHARHEVRRSFIGDLASRLATASNSRATAIGPTSKPWSTCSAATSITPSSSRSTGLTRKGSARYSPPALRRLPGVSGERQSRPEAHLNELRGAQQPHHADAHAAVYAPDECILEEGREPRARGRLHFMYYNFCKLHKAHRLTPAMAAGVTDQTVGCHRYCESAGGLGAEMNWDRAIKVVTPHVVKISTPTGYGTGFLSFYNHDSRWCGIATAAHVVSHADEWQQPIRITHPHSKTTEFRTENDRVIMLDHIADSAIVLCLKGELQLPEVPIALLPMSEPCGLGVDIGWLGFPAIEPSALCFFAGTVSARLEGMRAYLIDGVAINGVSGGPVFHCPRLRQGCRSLALVAAYHANRVTGETLPGLLRAQDVSHFHGVAATIRNIDEANAKKAEFEAAQKEREQSSPASIEPTQDPDAVPTKATARRVARNPN